MSKLRTDALFVLRSTARKVKKCTLAVQSAVRRRKEVRLLELEQLECEVNQLAEVVTCAADDLRQCSLRPPAQKGPSQ